MPQGEGAVLWRRKHVGQTSEEIDAQLFVSLAKILVWGHGYSDVLQMHPEFGALLEHAAGVLANAGQIDEPALTGGQAYQKCKKQQARIDVGLQVGRGSVAGQECDERPYGNGRRRYAEQSTGKCEKYTVGKKLSSNSPARRSQCQSCADFPIASRAARPKKSGNIQASQSQERNRRHE